MRRSRARLLSHTIAVGLGLLLALAVGELALRLVAVFSPGVRYLSTAGGSAPARRFASLPEYLASRPEHLVPYRRWFNYWTNALGFNDEEFTLPKPAGRFRIMAVGDSFTYGLVPYPQNVMTVLESLLHAACPHRELDLLNLGIGAAGVHDYRTIIELGYETYEPDLVLVNFYAGNDGPDLRKHARRRPSFRALAEHSYLWTYASNALRLRSSLPDPQALAASVQGPTPAGLRPGERPLGGRIVAPGHRLRDDDPALVGPIFDEEAFTDVLADELSRFHVPGESREVGQAWRPVLADLEAARVHVARHGGELVITVYPSLLQVDARLRATLINGLRGRRRYAELPPDTIDSGLPNRLIAEYCRAHDLPCFDLTPLFVRAREESAEPLYKARDLHWTPRGNRVAAEAQAVRLAPLVCPTPDPSGAAEAAR